MKKLAMIVAAVFCVFVFGAGIASAEKVYKFTAPQTAEEADEEVCETYDWGGTACDYYKKIVIPGANLAVLSQASVLSKNIPFIEKTGITVYQKGGDIVFSGKALYLVFGHRDAGGVFHARYHDFFWVIVP